MAYKIKSLTNTLPVRDIMYMKQIEITDHYNGNKSNKTIFPGQELFLSSPTLPASVHTLRLKGLLFVQEVPTTEYDRVSTNVKNEEFTRTHPETASQTKLKSLTNVLNKIEENEELEKKKNKSTSKTIDTQEDKK